MDADAFMARRLEVARRAFLQARKSAEPTLEAGSFVCPHCGVMATQYQTEILATGYKTPDDPKDGVMITACHNCNQPSLWFGRKLVFPEPVLGPEPNADMPKEVMESFNEARSILSRSPRGATMMARYALEQFFALRGATKGKLAEKVKYLTEHEKLDPDTVDKLDIVRGFGNDASHVDGTSISDHADPSDAIIVLDTLNQIVEDVIETPRKRQERLNRIPPERRTKLPQPNQ